MGKLKKIGIGFGIIILSFIVLVIIGQVWMASLTPEERLQLEEEREKERLIEEQERLEAEKKMKAEEEIREMEEEQERLQKEIKLFRENRQLQKQIDEFEAQEKISSIEEDIINDPLYDVVFDPIVVRQAEKSIPVIQNSFRVILDECNSINSYSKYIVFATDMAIASDEINQLTSGMDQTLTVLEILGYDNHHTVGPLIEETRQLGGAVGNCIIDVQNKYAN